MIVIFTGDARDFGWAVTTVWRTYSRLESHTSVCNQYIRFVQWNDFERTSQNIVEIKIYFETVLLLYVIFNKSGLNLLSLKIWENVKFLVCSTN